MNIELIKDGKLPVKGTKYAACYDVYAREIIHESDSYVRVKLGFKSEIPDNCSVNLIPRSSITNSGWILCNSPGKIDEDFRGEWEARFRAFPTGINFTPIDVDVDCGDDSCESVSVPHYSLSYPDFPYQINDRVAQFELSLVTSVNMNIVDKVSETLRGEGGYGSTGKN